MKFDVGLLVRRPLKEVMDYFIKAENAPTWAVGMEKMRQITEGPVQLGTRFTWVVAFLGREMEETLEVIDFEPYETIAFKVVEGPSALTYRYTFEPSVDGTDVTLDVEGTPPAVPKLAEPVLTMLFKRELYTGLENLKDLLEAEALVPA